MQFSPLSHLLARQFLALQRHSRALEETEEVGTARGRAKVKELLVACTCTGPWLACSPLGSLGIGRGGADRWPGSLAEPKLGKPPGGWGGRTDSEHAGLLAREQLTSRSLESGLNRAVKPRRKHGERGCAVSTEGTPVPQIQ